MSIYTLTRDELVPTTVISGHVTTVRPPIITPYFRTNGVYGTINPGTGTGWPIPGNPGYFYLIGATGVTGYNSPNPLDGIKYNFAVGHPLDGNLGLVDTDDFIQVSYQADNVYAGPGNDTIVDYTGATAPNYFVGGSGNDTFGSSHGADIIYGDFADAPTYVNDTTWTRPAVADPNVVDGDDYIIASYGADTVYGGGGDDLIYGDDQTDTTAYDTTYNNADVLHGGDGNDKIYGGTGADTLYGEGGNDVLQGGRYGDTLNGGDGNDMLDGGPRGQGWTDVLTGGDGADAFMLSYTPASTADTEDDQSFWEVWGADFVDDFASGSVFDGVGHLASLYAADFFETVTGSILLGGLSTAIEGVFSKALGFLHHQNKTVTPQPTGEDVMVITDFDPSEDVLFLPVADGTTISFDYGFFSSSAAEGVSGWGVKCVKGASSTIFAEIFLSTDFLADFNLTSDKADTDSFFKNLLSTIITIDEDGVQSAAKVYPFPTDPSAYTEGVVPDVAAPDGQVPFTTPTGTTTQIFGAFGPQIIVGPVSDSSTNNVAATSMGDLVFVTSKGFAPDDWDNPHVVAQVTKPSLIMGYGGNDILNGSSGQDEIHGGDGNDAIYGWNAGDAPNSDLLYGEGGDDLLSAAKPLGGRGSAYFDGGDGTDTVSFAYSRYGVTANLATGTGANTGDTADAYYFTDVENLIGTALDDMLTGDANANVLDGLDGNDVLDGGDGVDTASFSHSSADGTVIDLAGGSATFASGEVDTLISIENVVGSDGGDTIIGSADANILNGGAGDDTLTGGAGADTIIGGDGYDIFAFADGPSGIHVDLAAGVGAVGSWIDAFGYHDTVDRATIEAYRGTSSGDYMLGDGGNGTGSLYSADFYGMGGNDFLAGNGLGQMLDGGDGNDTLNGQSGDDLLIGGAGADTITGGAGADIFEGTPGDLNGDVFADFATDDILRVLNPGSYPSGYAFGVTVIQTSTANTQIGITDAGGTNVLAKLTLWGDFVGQFVATAYSDHADIVYVPTTAVSGTLGDDLMTGSGEGDIMYGGAGDDTLLGHRGSDRLFGEAHRDVLRGHKGNDGLYGGGGRDKLFGGDGDDLLDGGAGGDRLEGGAGFDLASYDSARTGVFASLRNSSDNSGDAEGDTYADIEGLEGSRYSDLLRGDTNDNRLSGGKGDDQIEGRNGDDVIRGGGGQDILIGQAGADRLIGNGGMDVFRFDEIAHSSAGASDLIVDFEQGFDRIALNAIDANAVRDGRQIFDFVGSTAFSGLAGELRASVFKSRTVIEADIDGDALADLEITLKGSLVLTAEDFVL